MSFREGRVDLEEDAVFSFLNLFCIAFQLPYHPYHFFAKLTYIFFFIGDFAKKW